MYETYSQKFPGARSWKALNAKQGTLLFKQRSLWEVSEQGRAVIGVGNWPRVESGCPWVLGRGFDGKLSTYGGHLPAVSQRGGRAEPSLPLAQSDLYWLIFTLKG